MRSCSPPLLASYSQTGNAPAITVTLEPCSRHRKGIAGDLIACAVVDRLGDDLVLAVSVCDAVKSERDRFHVECPFYLPDEASRKSASSRALRKPCLTGSSAHDMKMLTTTSNKNPISI